MTRQSVTLGVFQEFFSEGIIIIAQANTFLQEMSPHSLYSFSSQSNKTQIAK